MNKILPTNLENRKWISVGLTILIAAPLTTWGIYGIGKYGLALFVLTPVFIGLSSTILYGYNRKITTKESWQISFLTLGLFTLGLFGFAVEGLICIAMAAPIGLFLTWIGALIGMAILDILPNNSLNSILLIIILIPTTAFFENNSTPEIKPVVSKVIIDATPEVVWKNVIEFPQLDEPTEFIFNAGIAYPINARIEGTGVGAIRHCTFNTGNFVEPITVWDEPKLLMFDVIEQPIPLRELSFWDIDAPHLHDYFVSKKGQFKLRQLPSGQTELEGTTWYYHNVRPDFYWKIWSNLIIHSIHNRVLKHIESISEEEMNAS